MHLAPRGLALLAALAAVALATAAASEAIDDDTLWAVVVAGSSGYGNYRHQADAAHAYHTLRAHGVPAGHVILMSADDAADSPYAPERYRGKLLNAPPPSPDVRAGAPVDYTGGDVTATTLLAVLLGDRGTVDRVAPNSTRRVLASGPADRLFLFFVDHGAPGLVGMPSGPPLFAPDLADALRNMTARRDGAWSSGRRHHPHRRRPRAPGAATFKEAVLFVEACESGSMFDGFLARLPIDPARGGGAVRLHGAGAGGGGGGTESIGAGVFGLTAANGHESSWGTFCPDPATPGPLDAFQTCLGDLFAVSWLAEADRMLAARAAAGDGALAFESLADLAAHVAAATSVNHTYVQGSHVHAYGDGAVEAERAEAFIGQPAVAPAVSAADGERPASHPRFSLPAADADTLHARLRAAAGDAVAAADLAEREAVAAAADAVVAAVRPPAGAASVLLALPPRPVDAAAVDDWGCLRAGVAAWEAECGVSVSRHVTRVGRALAAACNAGAGAAAVVAAVGAACGGGGGSSEA